MQPAQSDGEGQVLVRLRDATAALEAAVSSALRSAERDRLGLHHASLGFIRHASLVMESHATTLRALAARPRTPPTPRPRRSSSRLSPARLQKVFLFVRANLPRAVRLRDLAAAVRLSPHHFARAFKASTRESPGEFVRRHRIEMAASLLRETERSLADIALAAGFGGQGHLTTAFRLARGVTPGRYRRGLALERVERETSKEVRG